MAFNRIIKASNVWHNKCPEHLFTDMLYKGKQQQVKGGGGYTYAYTRCSVCLLHYSVSQGDKLT